MHPKSNLCGKLTKNAFADKMRELHARKILMKFFQAVFVGQVWSVVARQALTAASKTAIHPHHPDACLNTDIRTYIYYIQTCIHTYIHTVCLIQMVHCHREVISNRKRANCLSLLTRIRTRASHKPTLLQIECPLTNRLSSCLGTR